MEGDGRHGVRVVVRHLRQAEDEHRAEGDHHAQHSTAHLIAEDCLLGRVTINLRPTAATKLRNEVELAQFQAAQTRRLPVIHHQGLPNLTRAQLPCWGAPAGRGPIGSCPHSVAARCQPCSKGISRGKLKHEPRHMAFAEL